MREIQDRPPDADFDWFVRDLVGTAIRKYGYEPIAGVGTIHLAFEDFSRMVGEFTHPEITQLSRWRKRSVPYYIDVDVLQTIWSKCLRGEEEPKNITASFCFQQVLKSRLFPLEEGPPYETNQTPANAQAFARALREVLAEEIQRYEGSKVTEIEAKLRDQDYISQKDAATLLGCTDRTIRNKIKAGEIEKDPAGKVKTSSILQLRKKR